MGEVGLAGKFEEEGGVTVQDAELEEQDRRIGARIAQARKERGGMRQEDLARELGVSIRSLQGYETGEVVPYNRMDDLGRILGREPSWFVHGDELSGLEEAESRLAHIEARLAEIEQAHARTNELLAQTNRLLEKIVGRLDANAYLERLVARADSK